MALKLRITDTQTGKQRTVEFVRSEITIGRVASNHLVLTGHGMSREHTRLTVRGDKLQVVDLGSTNGTFVDGQRLSGAVLIDHSSHITVGDHLIEVIPAQSHHAPMPEAPLDFRVRVTRGEATIEERMLPDTARWRVGRGTDNAVVLDDEHCSRIHAEFYQQGEQIIVRDLGTVHGTFVDGERLSGPMVLESGATVSIGGFSLLVEWRRRSGLAQVSSKPLKREEVPLDKITIKGELAKGRAKLTTRLHFINREDGPVEAVYDFAPTQGAAFRSVKVWLGSMGGGATAQDPEEAQEQYNTAVKTGHSAALIESRSARVARVVLGNLMPGEEAVVEIDSVVPMRREVNSWWWEMATNLERLPDPDDPTTAEVWPSVPYRASVEVSLEAPGGLRSVGCESHPIHVVFGQAGARVVLLRPEDTMAEDIALCFEPVDNGAVNAAQPSTAGMVSAWRSALVLIKRPWKSCAQRPATRRIVPLLDRSAGSH